LNETGAAWVTLQKPGDAPNAHRPAWLATAQSQVSSIGSSNNCDANRHARRDRKNHGSIDVEMSTAFNVSGSRNFVGLEKK